MNHTFLSLIGSPWSAARFGEVCSFLHDSISVDAAVGRWLRRVSRIAISASSLIPTVEAREDG
jgi:hypothetical protein